jgi:hypothetical protein
VICVVLLLLGGDRMNRSDLQIEAFVTWLCQREGALVGRPCSFYHSPLACWLSEYLADGVYGVDGQWYGRALHDCRCWRLLPRWAVLFSSWLESLTSLPVTGVEALDVLARVEWALRVRAA